jgi:acyl-coenzyme A thioesterase PaaI-like protein
MIGPSSLGLVADSYFVPVHENDLAGRYLAGPHTVGPWAEDLQHGGPPNALAVVCAERALQARTGRTDLVALRLAADFVGPVPVGEVETHARVIRAARSAALVEVTLSGAGRDCLLVRVWFVRRADTSALAASVAEPVAVPDVVPSTDFSFGYGRSVEWRVVHGRMRRPGPAAVWARPTVPLLDGHELTGLARVALVADSASGISAELDWDEWSFVNVDLDIHLARPSDGEWVSMDATTQLGGHGSALARSTLGDVRGPVGTGLQTLVVAPIPTSR